LNFRYVPRFAEIANALDAFGRGVQGGLNGLGLGPD
jgi:hypothetical protein